MVSYPPPYMPPPAFVSEPSYQPTYAPPQQSTFFAGMGQDGWLQYFLDKVATAQPPYRLAQPIFSPVPPRLFEVRPRAYLPRKITFGLFNNTDLAPSPADHYKALCVQTLMISTGRPLEELMMYVASEYELSQHFYWAAPIYSAATLRLLLTADCASILDIIGFIDTGVLQGITRSEVVLDLFLVNNQVPLLNIKKLASLWDDPSFTRLSTCLESISRFRNPFRLRDQAAHNPVGVTNEENRKSMLDCQHLLDCLYTACVGAHESDSSPGCFETAIRIPRASELRKVGVKFRVAKDQSPGAVSYERYVLSLPKLAVFHETEPVLRNLLAYEVMSENARDVCAYAVFMDSLIDTAEDVDVLRKAGVLENHLGNDERMLKMWNDMCINLPEVFSQRWFNMAREIERDYNSKCNKMYVEFYNLFLSRPWLWLSTLAAVALLLMTALQTFYSVTGYYRSQK